MVAIGVPFPVWEEFVAEFLGVVVVVVGDVVEVVIILVCH